MDFLSMNADLCLYLEKNTDFGEKMKFNRRSRYFNVHLCEET